MELVYKTGKKRMQFWEFYNSNRNSVELILNAACRPYGTIMEAGDMKNEILLRLHENKVLKQYNDKMCKLNTYLTIKVRCYAQHIMAEEARKMIYANGTTLREIKSVESGEKTFWSKVTVHGINNVTGESPIDSEFYDGAMQLEDHSVSMDMDITYNDLLNKIVQEIKSPIHKEIFFLRFEEDLDYEAIAKKFNKTMMWVSVQCSRIMEVARKFLDNGEYNA